MNWCSHRVVVAFVLCICFGAKVVAADVATEGEPLPAEIQTQLEKPLYKGGVWGLLVVDLDSGKVIYNLHPKQKFRIGSVRKLFSIGLALDKLGINHKFVTPIYRSGEVKNGILTGNLVLAARGDLSMGGRQSRGSRLAITDYDHNEANSLGNAELTATNPLAGYANLAQQVARAGIKEVNGDVLIDDRLFVPFNFRNEFDVRPIFVNDDVVDVMIESPGLHKNSPIDWRPKSEAFTVKSSFTWASKEDRDEIKLEPECPTCFGAAKCQGTVEASLPVDYEPPLTKSWPVVRTFRITEPQNFVRTVLIEALEKAGVRVSASAVGRNDPTKLPDRKSYQAMNCVAALESPPYFEYARWILKVSYNIGADTSLVLFGLTQGVNSLPESLAVEKRTLSGEFGIADDQYEFVDGSGGGESAATPTAIVTLLERMHNKKFFTVYRDCLPILATDGSLAFVTDFAADKSLAGAKGNVWAKTGTFLAGNDEGKLSLRAQALAGYINAKSGRRLAFALVVNDVSPISGIEDLLQVFQDQGTIAAIIWREN